MTFQPKKLSLVGIALLVASIALIFLSKLAVNQVAFNLFLLSSFTDVAALNMYTLLFAVAGYVLMAAGAALFVYVAWRSRFVVDAPTVKRQLRVLIVAVAVLLVTLSLFCTQAASANSLATTGYYLATPYSPYDWLIGKFSTGTTYAINGSNWANMMTWPTPAPWSDYAGNSTQVIEAALAATTAGTVYLKEVPMNYSLTIPANVQVIENVNGLTRVFIDDAESQGSPYTVSVDTVQTTYYTVQDCADRYIISWTSTEFITTINKALNNTGESGGGVVYVSKTINATYSTAIKIHYSNVHLIGEAGNHLYHTGIDYCLNISPVIVGAAVSGIDEYLSNVLVEGLNITSSGGAEADGITVTFLKDSIIRNNFIYNTTEEGIALYDSVRLKVHGNYLENCGTLSSPTNPAIEVKETELNLHAYDSQIYGNTIVNPKRTGILVYGTTGTKVFDNLILNSSELTSVDNNCAAIMVMSGVASNAKNIVVQHNTINNSRWYDIVAQGFNPYSVQDLRIENNILANCRKTSIYLLINQFNDRSVVSDNTIKNAAVVGVLLQNVTGMTIRNNVIVESPYGTGEGNSISVYSGSNDNKISGNTICHSAVGSVGGIGQRAIYIGTNCMRNQITDNKINRPEAVNQGIYIDDNSDNNFVSLNSINGSYYGIRVVGATCDNNVIQNNQLVNNNALVLGNTGTGTIVKYNIGYVTENTFSGANTTATTAVLNHGLFASATGVWVSFNDTTITGYTWTSTATQITITPTGTLPAAWTCYVNAVYKP
jgi:parallel beta-helix repeat protein